MREIGSRRELFVDDWLVESLNGAALKLNHPVAREVAIPFDAPWEGLGSHYVTILQVGDEYRTYYRGASITAVATSTDGVTWTRPNLGAVEWKGSKDNNIVMTGDASHAFVPFLDANPAARPAERFKAVATERLSSTASFPRNRGLIPYVSEDGFSWRKLQEDPIITDGAFDSQNLVYWDSLRGQYVAFYRDFRDGVRSIKFATSPDFLQWTSGEWEDYGNTPLEHFYTNATISYFRAPHIYLSFPMRFVPDRKAIEECPDPGVSDAVFMSSRDGVHWNRTFMEAFIRPGRDRDNWTHRSNAPAWGILATSPDELSVYWLEHYHHPNNQLRRGTLRMDGFASVNAGYAGGEMLTKPLTFEGRELEINYSTSAPGSVQVEIQDAEGRPISGYTLDDCLAMYGDSIEAPVQWQSGSDVSRLAGQPVRLRFVLKDADVFSLRFRG